MSKIRLSSLLARLGLRRKASEDRIAAGPMMKMARRYEAELRERERG